MQEHSYTLFEDDTFEIGYLADKNIEKLNLISIEIWGLGTKQTKINQ